MTAQLFTSKASAVAHFLRRQIMSGVLKPGQKVTLAELSAMADTSQMPVREAVNELAREGLMEIVPHKGMRVMPLDAEDIPALFAVRGVLEALAAELAAGAGEAALVPRLRELNARFAEAFGDGEIEAMTDLNWQFHRLILDAADNPHLDRELTVIWGRSRRFGAAYGYIRGRAEQAIADHERICDVLADGDPAAAFAEMRRHVYHAGRDLYRTITEADGAA